MINQNTTLKLLHWVHALFFFFVPGLFSAHALFKGKGKDVYKTNTSPCWLATRSSKWRNQLWNCLFFLYPCPFPSSCPLSYLWLFSLCRPCCLPVWWVISFLEMTLFPRRHPKQIKRNNYTLTMYRLKQSCGAEPLGCVYDISQAATAY